jgi:hypothetical protein
MKGLKKGLLMKKALGLNCSGYLLINNTGDALYTIFGENLVNNI